VKNTTATTKWKKRRLCEKEEEEEDEEDEDDEDDEDDEEEEEEEEEEDDDEAMLDVDRPERWNGAFALELQEPREQRSAAAGPVFFESVARAYERDIVLFVPPGIIAVGVHLGRVV